jgi:hypothetical protein
VGQRINNSGFRISPSYIIHALPYTAFRARSKSRVMIALGSLIGLLKRNLRAIPRRTITVASITNCLAATFTMIGIKAYLSARQTLCQFQQNFFFSCVHIDVQIVCILLSNISRRALIFAQRHYPWAVTNWVIFLYCHCRLSWCFVTG